MERWYVVATKPKKESQLQKIFEEGGVVVYAPRTREGGRARPFFPGYQFVFFDYPAQFKLVKYTRGVKRIVGNEAGPIPLDETIIAELRAREVDGWITVEKHGAVPEAGDEIEVAEGPLKGLRGVFQKNLSDRDRVLILLNYVSYQGQLLIEKSKLKKISP